MNKEGQITIFVIIALVIATGIVLFMVLRSQTTGDKIPPELLPVFDYYQSCIRQEAESAVQLISSQGGHLDEGQYIPGSDFAPFSSHLNFLGIPIPYWYYVAGNGLIREQVPSKTEIELEVQSFIERELSACDFSSFYEQGFTISRSAPEVKARIEDNKVVINVNEEITATKDSASAKKTLHEAEISTKLGRFYDIALQIYTEQKQNAFLEHYAADVLYLYAPVEGVEIQCSPKIWRTQNVINELKQGLESNLQAVQINMNEKITNRQKYFTLEKSFNEDINIMYAKNWPTKIEVDGENVDESVLIANPVGAEAGLGIAGFCYVPYHFVYDVSFPVLIQIYDANEIFQFPVAVIIDNNLPRSAPLSSIPLIEEEFDLCEFKNQEIEISLFDINLNPVNANISYECFSQRCFLGETKQGVLRTAAPSCANGFVSVRAEGYAEKKVLFSTNREKFSDIILEKEHENEIQLFAGGIKSNDKAIVSFSREDGFSSAAALPEFNRIKLSEGNYEIKVYVYGNSSLKLPSATKTECVDVPRSGLLGLFGGKKEKCFTITLPETEIGTALIGGGKLNTYILEDDLNKGVIKINVKKLPAPDSLDALQKNFEIFETNKIEVEFQ